MPPADAAAGARPHRGRGSTRRDPLLLAAVAAALLVLRVGLGFREPGTALPRGAAELVRWQPIEDAEATARLKGRPILYDFTADWCPPCRVMKREVFSDSSAAAFINASFVPVRVLDRMREEGRNANWVDSLQARFHVSAFPTLVVVRTGGARRPAAHESDESARIEGYLGRDFTLGQLDAAAVRLRGSPTPQGADSVR